MFTKGKTKSSSFLIYPKRAEQKVTNAKRKDKVKQVVSLCPTLHTHLLRGIDKENLQQACPDGTRLYETPCKPRSGAAWGICRQPIVNVPRRGTSAYTWINKSRFAELCRTICASIPQLRRFTACSGFRIEMSFHDIRWMWGMFLQIQLWILPLITQIGLTLLQA